MSERDPNSRYLGRRLVIAGMTAAVLYNSEPWNSWETWPLSGFVFLAVFTGFMIYGFLFPWEMDIALRRRGRGGNGRNGGGG